MAFPVSLLLATPSSAGMSTNLYSARRELDKFLTVSRITHLSSGVLLTRRRITFQNFRFPISPFLLEALTRLAGFEVV